MTTTGQFLGIVRAAGRAGVPVLLWGTPGTGKSALVEAIGRIDEMHVEVVIGSLREPADLAGLPVVRDDDSVVLAPPRWARNLVEAGGGYLFLDELSTASPSVQAAMLRVAKERIVGDLALPPDTRIIAAANPVDVAAGGWELEPPTANRFLHLDYKPDVESWSEGLSVGFNTITAREDRFELLEGETSDAAAATAHIVGFLRSRPDKFNDCPTDPTASGRGWPSPRTWHYLQQMFAFLPYDATEARMLAAVGLVGDAAAIELMTWIRHSDLPDPALVLDGEVVLDPSERDDRLFAILAGVAAVAARRGDADAWERAWTIVSQVPVDIAAATARSLFASRPSDARIPDAVLEFEPILRRAGMVAT